MRRTRGSGCGLFAGYLLLMWVIPTGIVFWCFRHFLHWPVGQSLVVAGWSWFLAVQAIATVGGLVFWCWEKVVTRRNPKTDDRPPKTEKPPS